MISSLSPAYVSAVSMRSVNTLIVVVACGGLCLGVAQSSAAPPIVRKTGPSFVALDATPAQVSKGSAAILSWRAPGAAGCSGLGGWAGSLPAVGTQSTGPLTTTRRYIINCGGVIDGVTVTVAPIGQATPFPLRIAPHGRYLVDSVGRPFLIQGDAAWSLIVQLKREDVDRYLDERKRQGFNTVLVELIEHKFSDHPPANAYGVRPFHRTGDFSTPNEAYFAYAEYVVARAAEHGMLVLLAPAYMGYKGGDQGWYREMKANGAATLREYGRYVGRRFRQYDNIIWIHGGDFAPPERELLRAVVDGIRDVRPSSLHGFHGIRGTSALEFLGPNEQWLTVNSIYTDETDVEQLALREYARSQKPFFLIEAIYEGESGAQEQVVRRQAYQAVLSGADGQVMGNGLVWKFAKGWQPALESAGARSMAHLHALLDQISWWTLVPDASHQFLLAGAGSGARAVAAVDQAGHFALAYLPDLHAITVDLGRLRGPMVMARWYDPSSGTFRVAGGFPLPAKGLRVMKPRVANASGLSDWALLLESIP